MSELQTLQDILRRFDTFGDAPAVLAPKDGDFKTYSFAAVARAADRIAVRLKRPDVEAKIPVALIGPNSPAWVAAFWGAVAAGAVAMPLDAQCSDQDLAHMLKVSNCRLALAASTAAQRVRAAAPSCEVIIIDDALSCPGPVGEAGHAPPAARAASAAEATALLLFTSGTTGTPKAVPLTHANLLSNVRALLAEGVIQPGDRGLIPLPLHHSYPLTVGMLTMFAGGASLVLPSGISGPEMINAMQQGRVTVLLGVPRLYEALFTSLVAAVARRRGMAARMFPLLLKLSQFARRHLRIQIGRALFRRLREQLGAELRYMVCGGAAIAPHVEEGLDALGWEMLTGYGLTETSPILSFNRRGQSRVGSVGRALPGIELRIWEPDAEGAGEIQARGSSVFAGYLDDPAATRGAFTVEGWFRTGDLGRLDEDGCLTVVGRLKETIVLPDGKKLLLETVEAAYATSPLFRELAVLPDGSGLVALVVPDFEAIRAAGATRMEDLIRETLDATARTLPSHYRLTGLAILREALPRTQLGKIRRRQLRALYDAAHEARRSAIPKPLAPEDTALLENPVAQTLWRWLKARYKEQSLDLDTSPQLDLGMDSLGWIDFTLALEHDLHITLTEKEIARVVTLRDLLQQALVLSAREAQPAALTTDRMTWLDPLGGASLFARRIGESLFRLGMTLCFSPKVEGREHLPAAGPFLLCPNHVSYLDAFAVAAALPYRQLRSTYWAGWTGILFHTRLRRLFSRLAQIIPVDPDRALASNLALSAMVFERGCNLAWFPEGALSPDGTLQRFLPGVGALLEQKPVPVIPVLIRGTRAAWPPGKKIRIFRPVSVRFGPPVDPAGLISPATGRERQQQIADAIHDAVAKLER